jgi:hypothetical protein
VKILLLTLSIHTHQPLRARITFAPANLAKSFAWDCLVLVVDNVECAVAFSVRSAMMHMFIICAPFHSIFPLWMKQNKTKKHRLVPTLKTVITGMSLYLALSGESHFQMFSPVAVSQTRPIDNKQCQ